METLVDFNNEESVEMLWEGVRNNGQYSQSHN